MHKFVYHVVLSGAAFLLVGGSAHSQILNNSIGNATVVPVSAPIPVPDFKWDYRFDAQYNSTIKPYLRWYRREGNNLPSNGVRYPYYHGPQPYYGTSSSGSCCGGTTNGYIPNYVQPRQSSWFNPYRRMDQGQPIYGSSVNGDHQGVLQYLSKSETKPEGSSVEVKTAWIKHESATNGVSILYASPVEALRDQFYEAKVTTVQGRVTKVEWVDAPTESLTTIVAKYKP